MFRSIDLDLLHSQFLEALLTGKDAQGIVDCAYSVVGMPILAFDVEFRLLAFAFERPCYYAPWEEIAGGQGTASFMEYLPNQERIFRYGSSLLFDHADDPDIWFSEVACAIKDDNRLIGYVGTIVENADVQIVIQANDLLANVLSYYYSHEYAAKQTQELGFSELLGVLNSDNLSQKIKEKIRQAYAPDYFCAVIVSDRQSIADLQFISGTFCRETDRVIGRVDDNGYLNLLFWHKRSTDLYWIAFSLENIGQSMGAHCGVSDLFSDLEDFSMHNSQALETLRVGQSLVPNKRVHLFSESISLLICDAALKQFGPKALLPSELKLLINADGSDGKYYIETLEAFLSNLGSPSKTARELGIHGNTLANRLRKMQDCMGTDMKDPRLIFRLQMGLEMLRLCYPDGSWEVE